MMTQLNLEAIIISYKLFSHVEALQPTIREIKLGLFTVMTSLDPEEGIK